MNLVTASRDGKEPSGIVLISSTTPAASATLHNTLKAGQAVRSCAAVHFQGPALVFSDIRSVPAAVPPLPNAGGVRGGRPSYAAKQGAADFAFDYGLAFSLRPAEAFARGGSGSTCLGRACGRKGAVYARGGEPFIWERKRNRGGAVICRGGGGHLLCLRCVEAQYEEGSPFISSASGGPVPQQELFTKYEVVPSTKEVREVRSGEEASEGGHQFFVQRRDLAPCPYCREPKAAALARRGVKRTLEEGPSPRELGTVALLRPFAREVTSGVPWVLPLEQGGCVGGALFGLDAKAWRGGPQLRVFVVNNPGEKPVVCVFWGENAHCSDVECSGSERCWHLVGVLSKQTLLLIERAADGGGVEAKQTLAERRAERVGQREAGARRLFVCNDPACRRPDSRVACTHQETLEPWECLSAAALDMGHSHKRIDTVMSRGGARVTSLCERWGEEGVRRREEARHFCAPRPAELLSPCGRPWQLESRRGSLTTAGGRYPITTYRRVCRIAPGREAACCSVAYDGQEDGIFNFSGTNLVSHGLLLRNHFAAALGAAHSLNFEAGDMATRCLEGPDVPRLDDRVFDSAMQAFNDLAARPRIQ
ncbi:hypothetical protein KFL_007750070, partial [Klebsormidium nitens]